MKEPGIYGKININKSAFAVAILIIFITMISPAEKTLGSTVRIVYIHVALIWISIVLFSLAALFGLVHLGTNNEALHKWSNAIFYTAILIWGVNLFVGFVVQTLAWGAISWSEPRNIMAVNVLLVSLFFLIGSKIISKPFVDSFSALFISFFMWFSLFDAKLIMHPRNPIMGTDYSNFKIYTLIISVLVLVFAALIANSFRKRLESK